MCSLIKIHDSHEMRGVPSEVQIGVDTIYSACGGHCHD